MNAKLNELTLKETELFNYWRGNIPEANTELNDLQREKINAVYMSYGKAYIGKVNFYDNERESLTVDNVFTEYSGDKVYNFCADYIIPIADNILAEMIIDWNGKLHISLNLISKITNRVTELGGVNLIWS